MINKKGFLMMLALLIFIFVIIAFSSCGVINAEEYAVEENQYSTTLSFKNLREFKKCVEDCMTDNITSSYVQICMDDEGCSSCIDVCYESYKPDRFLIMKIFEDIDNDFVNPHSCFINNLN